MGKNFLLSTASRGIGLSWFRIAYILITSLCSTDGSSFTSTEPLLYNNGKHGDAIMPSLY